MTTTTAPCILVVSDDATDAALVKDLLASEFSKVMLSTLPDKAVEDFDRELPSVLVLAFDELEKAERYYLGLYRLSTKVHSHRHRTVILCSNTDLKRVSALCMKQHFDDYVLFWPMNHDAPRLPMTIHLALRALEARSVAGPSEAQVAAQARRLAELEAVLDQQLVQGGQRVEHAAQAMKEAGAGIDSALDGLSQRLESGALKQFVETRDSAGLSQEIARVKRDEVGRHLQAASQSLQPLEQWVGELKQHSLPRHEAVRTLNAAYSGVRQIVLMVDDDDFQRLMVTKLLDREQFLVMCADSVPAAFGILRKTRPDVILMDLRMPEIDGIQATRRLKAIPHLAAIPVLMLTGKSEGDAVVQSLKAGACDFIVKPTDAKTLTMKLARAMKGNA